MVSKYRAEGEASAVAHRAKWRDGLSGRIRAPAIEAQTNMGL